MGGQGGRKHVNTTDHRVDLPYEREELEALFALASKEDVDAGGHYDRRFGAINVWSHPWTDDASWQASDTVGTLYANWADPRIYLIETDEGHSLDDLLRELALLEERALGYVKHGKRPNTPRAEG